MKWYNVADILKYNTTFNFTFGGRGIGKTYSTLKWLVESGKRFIYLRNAQTEIDMGCLPECNPFKAINADMGTEYYFKKVSKEMTCVYDGENNLLGYATALSTYAKLRGVDFSDVEVIFFEEFNTSFRIPKEQGTLFCNFYETVNRNRELLGKPPVICIMMGNAITIANPIIATFGLIETCEQMIANGIEISCNKESETLVEIVNANLSEVSNAKKETALYKAIKGTDYYNHSVDNAFTSDSFFNIAKMNLNEYKPLCKFDDVVIFGHKTQRLYYACIVNVKAKSYNKDTKDSFLREYGTMLRNAQIDNVLFYQNFAVKTKIAYILY